MNHTVGQKGGAAKRLLEHGLRVLKSFQGDISSFLDQLPAPSCAPLDAQTWGNSENTSLAKAAGTAPTSAALSTDDACKNAITRITSVISMLHEDVDAMLEDLNALTTPISSATLTKGPWRSSKSAAASWMIPKVVSGAAGPGSDEAFWREAQKLAGLGIDLIKEAVATSAAAARLRSQSEQAAELASSLREMAWKKVYFNQFLPLPHPSIYMEAFIIGCFVHL